MSWQSVLATIPKVMPKDCLYILLSIWCMSQTFGTLTVVSTQNINKEITHRVSQKKVPNRRWTRFRIIATLNRSMCSIFSIAKPGSFQNSIGNFPLLRKLCFDPTIPTIMGPGHHLDHPLTAAVSCKTNQRPRGQCDRLRPALLQHEDEWATN